MRQPSPDQAPKAAACPPAHISAVLVIGILCSATLRAGDQPARIRQCRSRYRDGCCAHRTGNHARDGERQIPSRGERIFKVERLGNGFADVSTEDGAIRGWVEMDHVLPLDKGTEYFTGKIAANPKDAQAYQARGRIWIEKEDWERAHPTSTRRSALPRPMPGAIILALVHLQKQEIDQAIAGFSEAIRLDPGFAVAYRDRGLAWDANASSTMSGKRESGTKREASTRKAGQVRYWQYGQAENSPDLAISDLSRFLPLSRFLRVPPPASSAMSRFLGYSSYLASKPGQSLTGVLSALLSAATPLEMAEESRFLVRTVTRSRTFKPFWHMLLWPDSRAALRESSGLDVNSSRQSHFPA